MSEIDTKIALENHEQRIVGAEHRIKDLEQQTETINSLARSVDRMAINMENMLENMKNHNKRLEAIEQKPAQNWDKIITALISALVGGAAGYIINLI